MKCAINKLALPRYIIPWVMTTSTSHIFSQLHTIINTNAALFLQCRSATYDKIETGNRKDSSQLHLHFMLKNFKIQL